MNKIVSCDKCIYNSSAFCAISECGICDCALCDVCWDLIHFNERLSLHVKIPVVITKTPEPEATPETTPEPSKLIKQRTGTKYCTKKGHEDSPCNLVCSNSLCKERLICGICTVTEHKCHNVVPSAIFIDQVKKYYVSIEKDIRKEIIKTKKKLDGLELELENAVCVANDDSEIINDIEKYVNIKYLKVRVIPQKNIDVSKIKIHESSIVRRDKGTVKLISPCTLVLLVAGDGLYKGQMNYYILKPFSTTEMSIQFDKQEPYFKCDNKDYKMTQIMDEQCHNLLAKLSPSMTYNETRKQFMILDIGFGQSAGTLVTCSIDYEE